jgi:hypothetical protein
LGAGNGFIAAHGRILAISELKEEVFDWGGGIPLGCHGSVLGSEILGADCPIFMPEVLKDLELSATTKFGDRDLERGEVFVRAAVGDHGDEDDLEFTEGFAVFACNTVLVYIFGNLKISETFRVWWSWSWARWLNKRGLVFRERDAAVVRDDKTKETEGGIRGCDRHGLVLNAFLECFECFSGRFLS